MHQRIAIWLFSTGILCSSATAKTYEFLEGKTLSEITYLSRDDGIPNRLHGIICGVSAYRFTYAMSLLGKGSTVFGAALEPTDLGPSCLCRQALANREAI